MVGAERAEQVNATEKRCAVRATHVIWNAERVWSMHPQRAATASVLMAWPAMRTLIDAYPRLVNHARCGLTALVDCV